MKDHQTPKPGLWYMASPYSHESDVVMTARFASAAANAALLMRAGWLIFSPITHTHPISQYGLPKGWDYWERYDRAIIERCDGVLVLQLDGWHKSKGVAAEIEIARQLDMPVEFLRV